MDTPGYDPVSVTGLLAGGCTLVAFTTGRGSAFGSKPAPTIKISSNSSIYQRMKNDIDFNAGTLLDDASKSDTLSSSLIDLIIQTASGAPTKSEILDYGNHEINPWILGATM